LSHEKGKETILHFVEITATEPSSDTAKAFGLFCLPSKAGELVAALDIKLRLPTQEAGYPVTTAVTID
jgi:hypothetical protein